MVEDVLGVLLVCQELLHFHDVFPNLGEVEWAEVLEESLVYKVLSSRQCTLSILKKKALGTSLGGFTSARYMNFSE